MADVATTQNSDTTTTTATTDTTASTLLTGTEKTTAETKTTETKTTETPTTTTTDAQTQTEKDAAAAAEAEKAKADSEKEKPAGAPEKYADFKLPDGVKLDDAAIGEFAPVAKELNLTQDQAQKLVDLQAAFAQRNAQAQVAQFAEQVKAWGEQAKGDKEYGGEKFDASVTSARLAVSKFGTPELTKLLNDTGMGSNPEVVRFMVKVGNAMSEDKLHTSSNSATTKSVEEMLYGGTSK